MLHLFTFCLRLLGIGLKFEFVYFPIQDAPEAEPAPKYRRKAKNINYNEDQDLVPLSLTPSNNILDAFDEAFDDNDDGFTTIKDLAEREITKMEPLDYDDFYDYGYDEVKDEAFEHEIKAEPFDPDTVQDQFDEDEKLSLRKRKSKQKKSRAKKKKSLEDPDKDYNPMEDSEVKI